MLGNQDIICAASSNFVPVGGKLNVHLLMEEFARTGNRVLYIESVGLGDFIPTSGKIFKKVLRRVLNFFKGVKRPLPNMYVYSPVRLPFEHLKPIGWINKRLLLGGIKLITRWYRFRNPILWMFLPNTHNLVGNFDEVLRVYHNVDAYEKNPGVNKGFILNSEKEMLSKVDLVFATSKPQFEKLKRMHRNVVYTPNVSPFRMFAKAMDPETKIPENASDLKHPVVGCIVNFASYRINFKLLHDLVKRSPDITFLFCGPVGEGDTKSPDIENFDKLSNAHFIGRVEYEMAPAYTKAMDACILPYNEYSGFPINLFQNLAAGRFVVITPLKSLEDLEPNPRVLEFETTAKGFRKALDRVLDDPLNPEDAAKRQELAKEHSWEKRFLEMDKILKKELADKDAS